MNENNEQNGGLFSDEYEAPKRENPYLKKNREKAKAEKAPKPPKEKKTKPVGTESPYVAVEDKPAYAPVPPVREEGEGYVRKRTFSDWMFEHVKLIAAIATALAILALVLITDVVDVVHNLITQTQQAEKEEISLLTVGALSEKGDQIIWSDLDGYYRNITTANQSVTWMLPVKGTQYEIWISGFDTDRYPVYVRLYDMKTGDYIELGKDDFVSFIDSHS